MPDEIKKTRIAHHRSHLLKLSFFVQVISYRFQECQKCLHITIQGTTKKYEKTHCFIDLISPILTLSNQQKNFSASSCNALEDVIINIFHHHSLRPSSSSSHILLGQGKVACQFLMKLGPKLLKVILFFQIILKSNFAFKKANSIST